MSETLTAEASAAVPTTVETPAVAPAPIPAAPVPQKSAAEMAREIVAGVTAPAEGFPGDPDVDTPAVDAAAETPAEPATPAEDDDKAEPETPETPAVPPRKLLAEFTVKDEKGEIEIPDLTLAFKANGEVREMPLDKVVKLAQQGFYNEERQREVETLRSEVPQLQQRVTDAEQRAQFFEQTWRQALDGATKGDYTVLQREIDAYAQMMTPEAQLARTQAELQRVTQQQSQQSQIQQDTQHAQQFATALSGAFSELEQQYPEVSHEEILGKFSALTAPLLQGGRLPPSAFSRVAQLVQAELVPFAESRQQERASVKVRAQQDADAANAKLTAAANAATAAAKRTLSRVTKPTSTASAAGGPTGTSPSTSPAPRTYATAQDALAGILSDVKATVGTPAVGR